MTVTEMIMSDIIDVKEFKSSIKDKSKSGICITHIESGEEFYSSGQSNKARNLNSAVKQLTRFLNERKNMESFI